MTTADASEPLGGGAVALAFHEATKVYPGRRTPAVSNLTLEIPSSEICVLIGPSGSGKTTAMQMVNRLIPAASTRPSCAAESATSSSRSACFRT